jgi:hypothetical protein
MLCMTSPAFVGRSTHIGTGCSGFDSLYPIESCVARFFFWLHCLALLSLRPSSCPIIGPAPVVQKTDNCVQIQRPRVRVLSGSTRVHWVRAHGVSGSQPLKASDLGETCLKRTVSTFLLIMLPCSYISGKYFSGTYGRNTVYLTYRRKCSHRLRLSYQIARAIVRSHPRLSAPGQYPVCIPPRQQSLPSTS